MYRGRTITPATNSYRHFLNKFMCMIALLIKVEAAPQTMNTTDPFINR